MILYNCQQKRYEKKKGYTKMVANTNKEKSKKKKERLLRLSVRVSPKVAEAINRLQAYEGKSLSCIIRDVIDEGLKAKKKEFETKD